jgi:ribosomal protein L22
MKLEKKIIKDGRHVGLDFYDLLIEEALIDDGNSICELGLFSRQFQC